jgi:hypothetical protein
MKNLQTKISESNFKKWVILEIDVIIYNRELAIYDLVMKAYFLDMPKT